MCTSHRAVIHGSPVFDRCAEHPPERVVDPEAARWAEIHATAARQSAEFLDRVRRAYDDVKDAARQLQQAEVPGEKIEHGLRLQERKWLGDRHVHDPDRDTYGWFVGTHEWKVHHPPGHERLRTYVIAGGILVGLGETGVCPTRDRFSPVSDFPGLALVWPAFEGPEAASGGGTGGHEGTAAQAEFWEEVLARLKELVPRVKS